MGHIVVDPNGKVVFGLLLSQVVIDCCKLAGSGILGAETVSAAYYLNAGPPGLIQSGDDIQIHRLPHGAGLFAAIQHSDLSARGRNGGGKMRYGEGTVQVNLHHSNLAAPAVEIIHSFFHSLRRGTHHNDDLFRIRSTVVVEELIVPTG